MTSEESGDEERDGNKVAIVQILRNNVTQSDDITAGDEWETVFHVQEWIPG